MTPSLRFCLLSIIVAFADAKMDGAALETAADAFLKLFKTLEGAEYVPLKDVKSSESFLGLKGTIEASGGTFGKVSDLYKSRTTELKRDDQGAVVSIGISAKQLKVAYESFSIDISKEKGTNIGTPLAVVCSEPSINLDLRVGKSSKDACNVRVEKVVASNLEDKCQVEAGDQPAINKLLTNVGRAVHHIFKERVEAWINEKVGETIKKEISHTKFIFCAVIDG